MPELKRNPSKLIMTTSAGKLKSWWRPDSLSYQVNYTLEITVLEYNGPPDTIFLPIIDWLKTNQVSALQNQDKDALSFEADILDANTFDISISIDLTEAVDVESREDGSFVLTHRKESPIAGMEQFAGVSSCVTLKEVYDQRGILLVPLGETDV